MKKRCFALLLALSLLLTGCSPLFDLYSAFRGEYTRPDYSNGAISYREFQRPYQPRVKYTAEPDIEYVRPDRRPPAAGIRAAGAVCRPAERPGDRVERQHTLRLGAAGKRRDGRPLL